MAADGVPIKSDREQAWRDFAGWRVNYDRVLIALATLVQAPYAPWSSDRSLSVAGRAADDPAASARAHRFLTAPSPGRRMGMTET